MLRKCLHRKPKAVSVIIHSEIIVIPLYVFGNILLSCNEEEESDHSYPVWTEISSQTALDMQI